MAYLTLQDIFTQGLNHLRIQRAPAKAPNGHCLYRAPNGHKCLIGALIPDDLYTPDMEELAPDEVPINADPAIPNHILIELQFLVHDHASGMRDFMREVEYQAQLFAKNYGLEYAPE